MALLHDNYIGNKMAGFRLNVLILIVTIAFQFVWFLFFLSILFVSLRGFGLLVHRCYGNWLKEKLSAIEGRFMFFL